MSSATLTILRLKQLPKILISPSRTAAYWNKDWMPGPYPKTEAERLAAAKKYNLLPEEYEPDSSDNGYGDYPKLPFISQASKDPHYNWDHPDLRKDMGEPMHTLAHVIVEQKWDCNDPEKLVVKPFTQMKWVIVVFGTFFSVMLFLDDKRMYLPAMGRAFPRDGVHYKYPASSS